MQSATQNLRDMDRLRELGTYHIYGTPSESEYDHIVRLTAELFEAPVALINMVGRDQVWVKARVGIDAQTVPCELAFCSHAILEKTPMIVPDLASDNRFSENPLVAAENGFRFYAGAPLISSEGYGIGTLCILDMAPRPPLNKLQARRLQDLAQLVMDKLEQRRLSRLEVIASKLMAATSDAVVVTDEHRNIAAWNPAAEAILGYSAEETIARPLPEIIAGISGDAELQAMLDSVSADGHGHSGSMEFTAHHRHGQEITISVSVAAWRDEKLGLSGFGAIIRDVTQQRMADRRISFLAHHDELTGLANRNSLHQQLENLLHSARRAKTSIALFRIDLDRFKIINETLGHRVGDALLKQVAHRFGMIAEQGDIVARLDGDEFAIVRRAPGNRKNMRLFAEAILSALVEPFEVNGHLVSASASLGIAVYPDQAADCDTLLNHADLAMYRTKIEGRNGFHFFEPGMDGQTLAKRGLERDLRGALQRGEFEVHYQPQIDLLTGRMTGAEALLRWRHPVHGLVSPADFIPIAESTGLILPIGRWVMETACRDFAAHMSGLRLAVNLSAVQFLRSDVVALVREALRSSGLPGSRLEIEITESLLLEKDSNTLDALKALKEMGVGIALDDFGTGYSSLSYLRSFPFDTIKIDRSFVKDADTNSDCAAILEAISALSATLDLTTVAEGIETEGQLAHMKNLGYQCGQGYLFGKPMPLEDLVHMTAGLGIPA